MSSDRVDRAALLGALHLALRQMSARSVLFSQAVAGRLGINPTDLECLDILSWEGPITAGRLAEATGLTTGAITGVIDRLEKAGYVRRERDPNDRRRVIIQPIPGSEGKISPLFESMARAADDLGASYSDEELVVILNFAARANAMAFAETAKLREGTAPAKMPDGATAVKV